MRQRTVIAVALSLGVLAFACKKEEKAPEPKPVEPKPAEPKPAEPKPAEPAGGLKGQNKMMHCPSAVPASATAIADTKDGVMITITAKDPKDQATVDEIRNRAKHMTEVSTVDPTEFKHTGGGTGGGGSGKCPVISQETKVTSKDVAGGTEFTILPIDPANLDMLRGAVRERQKAVDAEMSGGGVQVPPPAPGAPVQPG